MMAQFNVWANTLISDAVLKLPETSFSATTGGSFPSIRETCIHLRNAQHTWLNRLHGRSPAAFPSEPPGSSALTIMHGLTDSSVQLATYAETLDINGLRETCTYLTFEGIPYANSRCEILLHVLNHSTYHRGQIIHMMRQLGFPRVPSTDLIRFLRARG